MAEDFAPEQIEDRFNEAVAFHNDGRVQEALGLYEGILKLRPGHADAMHLSGLAYYQMGNGAEAERLIRAAIQANGRDAGYWSNFGIVLKSREKLGEALEAFESALALDERFLPALYNAAELHCVEGDLERGEVAYRRCLELNDGLPEVWTNLGLCLFRRKKESESEECLFKALEIQSDCAAALYGLGHLRESQGCDAEAAQLFEQAMRFGFDEKACLFRLAPLATRKMEAAESVQYLSRLIELGERDVSIYNNLGLAYQRLLEWENAEAAFKVALGLDPSNVDALTNYGAVLSGLGRFEEAVAMLDRCLEIKPENAIAYDNRGTALRGLAKLEEALESYRMAVSLDANRAEYFNNLGYVQNHLGDDQEMRSSFEEALRLNPALVGALVNYGSALMSRGSLREAKQLLDRALEVDPDMPSIWNNLGRYYFDLNLAGESREAYERHVSLDPEGKGWSSLAATQIVRSDIDDQELFDVHVRAGQEIESRVVEFEDNGRLSGAANKSRLRVGFLSADLKRHSVAYFLKPLLRNLDRSAFAAIAYSGVRNKDEVSSELEALMSEWYDVCDLSNDVLAQRIRADDIDILIDLSGYTAGNRCKVLAARPAPVQVSWLGYAHSSGMSRVDYRIVDSISDPSGETLNTETLLRIDPCFLVYEPLPTAPDSESLPMDRNGYVTFGNFNNLTKLSDKSVELFAQALHSVEGSRLILKSYQVGDDIVVDRLFERFAAFGIGPERLDLRGRIERTEDHLALYNEIDVALDMYPYTGTTTTCEALWMGVPVYSLLGRRHASRVSASILSCVGLGDWVAHSEESYLAGLQEKLARPEALRELRDTLRIRVERSPLRDEVGFGRRFGNALREAWQLSCR